MRFTTSSFFLVAALSFATVQFGQTPADAASYEWGFTTGNLNPDLGNGILDYAGSTAGITSFGTTNGTTVPNIGGVVAKYMSVPQMPDSTYGLNLTLTDSGANGGGSYINQYTFAFDLLIPSLPGTGYLALLNTNPGNPASNDADYYVKKTGTSADVGFTGNPYSSGGALSLNAWHRLVITADLVAGEIKMFIDGTRVASKTSGASVDGTWSLYSNANEGADVRLFNENYNDANNYTQAFLLSSVAFTDRTLSESEVAGLGGAKASGILVPEPTSLTLLAGTTVAFGALRRRKR